MAALASHYLQDASYLSHCIVVSLWRWYERNSTSFQGATACPFQNIEATGDNLVYAVRGSSGLFLRRGLGCDSSVLFEDTETPKEKSCSVFQFSHDGQIFAYCNYKKTRAFVITTGKDVLDVDLKRTKHILFSPRDSYVITYEPYVVYGPKKTPDQKPDPNMRVFATAAGKLVASFTATKEATWMPQFSDDESVVVRLIGSELLIHNGGQLERYDRKFAVPNIKGFAVSPGNPPFHVACYSSASGSSPGRVQIRTLDHPFATITAKNFFNTERATLQWNSRGTAVLVLSSTDVDSSNQSYYGEQHLFLLNVSSQESFKVHLKKSGPVHSTKWNPNGREFSVCYGYMPAMVSTFNLKGDEMFHISEGPRNDIFYNSFGNIMLTCGFGNLAKGRMEFWDVEKKKEIVVIEVPNTTLFEWAPDGQHFFTATTAPRLRIDNGYRMWHYSGRLVKEVLFDIPSDELWEVKFRPMPSYNKFEIRELTSVELASAGLPKKGADATNSSQSSDVGAAKQPTSYVPPHLRKENQPATTAVKMTDTEKKIFAIKKKLRDVNALKVRLANGEELQTSQLDKIAREPDFLAQLAALGGDSL